MNNNEQFTLTKASLISALEKSGSSIYELEEFLQKEAENNIGDMAVNSFDRVVGAFKPLGSWLLDQGVPAMAGAALLTGSVAGGAGYAAKRSLDNEDSEHDARKAEVTRYKQLTDRIKSDYGLS